MKKTLLALALAGLSSTGAMAAEPAAAEPQYTISGNFGLFSDYRFRGMSQTDKSMAAQGGFDFTHKSGAYLGTWTSNVSDWANTGGNGQEVDVYGGYRFSLGEVSVDVGYLAYIYPGNEAATKQNTEEAYLGLAYGPLSYKLSVATGDWFGYSGSGSTYHDLNLSYALSEKVSLGIHYGMQDVRHDAVDLDFEDYKVGLSYALEDNFTIGLAYVGVSGLAEGSKANFTGGSSKKLYESGAALSLTKTF